VPTVSTLDDLRIDAMHETMLDRCDALHVDEPEEGCPGCEDRAQRELEDREAEEEELAAMLSTSGVVVAVVKYVELTR
jgi:hypothetical protein